MTLKKLLSLIQAIAGSEGIKLQGCFISTTSGGELALEFNTQPSRALDRHLKYYGFILWETSYIYRPRS